MSCRASFSAFVVSALLAVTSMSAAFLASAPSALALSLPPNGATRFQFLPRTCENIVTSGGYPQVRVTGKATTWVHKMPKKPRLAAKPHQIYQTVRIRLQRRALGGWKSASKSFEGPKTTKGQTNRGTSVISDTYSREVADGATFRVMITVRIFTFRTGLPDHLHWKYEQIGPEFGCSSITSMSP